jgi:hypothetical protein
MHKPFFYLAIFALAFACSTPVALAADQCSAACGASASQCVKQAAEAYGRCSAQCKPGPTEDFCQKSCSMRDNAALSHCRTAENSCRVSCPKNSGTGNGSNGNSGHK